MDIRRLIDSLSSLLRQLNPVAVRLLVYDLDRLKVIGRYNNFSSEQLRAVDTELRRLEHGAIDYRTLQRAGNSISILRDLLVGELQSLPEPSAVILLGPRTFLSARTVTDQQDHVRTAAPQLYYLEFQPGLPSWLSRSSGTPPRPSRTWRNGTVRSVDETPVGSMYRGVSADPDGVVSLVSQLKGETVVIGNADDLAQAIWYVAARIPKVLHPE
jgi:hypothetical protein